MKKLLTITLLLISKVILAQLPLPYNWSPGTNPGWTSSNPSVNTLAYQSCYGYVSTSDCTGGGSWYTYNNSQITAYTSPTYNIVCATNINVNIRLDIFLNDRTGGNTYYDWFYFQYSTNGGTTWINPVALNGGLNGSGVNMSGYPPLTNWVNTNSNRNGWTGNTGIINITYNIPTSNTMKFRFIFESDASVNTQGISIYYADILAFGITCPVVLPIELTDFSCESKTDNITISWTTATELNNQEFQLWRSTDAVNWVKIATKLGAGTSTITHSYWFQDYFLPTGVYYYKLIQKDYNGTETSSDITSCNFILNSNLTITYYNLIGQEVKLEEVSSGFYIKESRNKDKVKREVIYK